MLLWFRGEREKGDQKDWGGLGWYYIDKNYSGSQQGGGISIFPPPVHTLCSLACAIPYVRKGENQVEQIKPHKGLSHLLPSGAMSRRVISPIKVSSSFLESDVVREQ